MRKMPRLLGFRKTPTKADDTIRCASRERFLERCCREQDEKVEEATEVVSEVGKEYDFIVELSTSSPQAVKHTGRSNTTGL
jgi:hypothetical protein